MSRGVLVALGVLVLGAGVALVLLLQGGESASATGTTTTQTTDSTTGGTAGTAGTAGASGAAGARPTLATGTAGDSGGRSRQDMTPTPTGTPGGPPPLDPSAPVVTPRGQPRGQAGGAGSAQDYAVGDLRVRDHRGSNATPMDVPPNVHTPEGPRIDSSLTAAIGKKIRPEIRACASGIKRDAWGASPRIEGQIVISVKAGQAGVISAIMQPRDLDAASASTLKSCLEPKLVGVTVPAPDQADLDSYSINVQTAIP